MFDGKKISAGSASSLQALQKLELVPRDRKCPLAFCRTPCRQLSESLATGARNHFSRRKLLKVITERERYLGVLPAGQLGNSLNLSRLLQHLDNVTVQRKSWSHRDLSFMCEIMFVMRCNQLKLYPVCVHKFPPQQQLWRRWKDNLCHLWKSCCVEELC